MQYGWFCCGQSYVCKSLHQSHAYLSFHIASVDQPGFRVLSGNVLLGQRPELLDFAAVSGSSVSVMASDIPSTAVVQQDVEVTINCSQWFQDNPGDDTYITRTHINEFGEEIGDPARLETSDPALLPRILVNDESVTIMRTILVQGAEDADFSIYMCQSCVTSEDRLIENCQSASVTVYPIGSAPEIDAADDNGELGSVDDPLPSVYCVGW